MDWLLPIEQLFFTANIIKFEWFLKWILGNNLKFNNWQSLWTWLHKVEIYLPRRPLCCYCFGLAILFHYFIYDKHIKHMTRAEKKYFSPSCNQLLSIKAISFLSISIYSPVFLFRQKVRHCWNKLFFRLSYQTNIILTFIFKVEEVLI